MILNLLSYDPKPAVRLQNPPHTYTLSSHADPRDGLGIDDVPGLVWSSLGSAGA
jgi:hypothetical protein